jgi:hypothetical protein
MPVCNPIKLVRGGRPIALLASAFLLLAMALPAGAATVGGNCVTTATKFRKCQCGDDVDGLQHNPPVRR